MTKNDQAAQPGTKLSSETYVAVSLCVLTVLLILGSRLISSGFGGWKQAEAIMILSSITIFLAYGQGLVILVRGLDLSVAATMSLGGILTYSWMGPTVLDVVVMLPVIVIITGGVGLVNGLGVSILKIPPFIMTLASSLIVYGSFLGLTGGQPSGIASPALTGVYTSDLLGVPGILWIILLFVVAGMLLQGHSSFGRRLYLIGTNPEAAFIAGLRVKALTISAYAISGATAGFAGVMMVGYASGATLTMGESFLLPSIAAVIVGGASILGGRGTYLATAAGAILLTTITTIISALGLQAGWRTVIYGGVILLALVVMREEASPLWMQIRKHFAGGR